MAHKTFLMIRISPFQGQVLHASTYNNVRYTYTLCMRVIVSPFSMIRPSCLRSSLLRSTLTTRVCQQWHVQGSTHAQHDLIKMSQSRIASRRGIFQYMTYAVSQLRTTDLRIPAGQYSKACEPPLSKYLFCLCVPCSIITLYSRLPLNHEGNVQVVLLETGEHSGDAHL